MNPDTHISARQRPGWPQLCAWRWLVTGNGLQVCTCPQVSRRGVGTVGAGQWPFGGLEQLSYLQAAGSGSLSPLLRRWRPLACLVSRALADPGASAQQCPEATSREFPAPGELWVLSPGPLSGSPSELDSGDVPVLCHGGLLVRLQKRARREKACFSSVNQGALSG